MEKIQKTRDYSIFKKMDGNRHLDRFHLKKLTASIEKDNQLNVHPIIVNRDFYVIDGQHTAIAAATRGDIEAIPVKIVTADTQADRAMAFVRINRDRLAVTASQIYFAEVAAGLAEAVGVRRMCQKAGVTILKYPPHRGIMASGDTLSVQMIRKIWRVDGEAKGVQILSIITAARLPVNEWLIRAVNILVADRNYMPRLPDEKISAFLMKTKDTLLHMSVRLSGEKGLHRGTACAEIIWKALK